MAQKKRGLRGFINGTSPAVFADTGASQNIMSLDYVRKLGLGIDFRKTQLFELGNKKRVRSIGIVQVQWELADPFKAYTLTCPVLEMCLFDVILGSQFLTETQTLSKYAYRISNCISPRPFQFCLLGKSSSSITGSLGLWKDVFALLDTGAECNVIDYHYAKCLGLAIDCTHKARNYLISADGSTQRTVGQTRVHWTFADGKQILVTFEVLENCASNIVLGEGVVYKQNVFEDYVKPLDFRFSSAVCDEPRPICTAELLAPFGYTNRVESAFDRTRQHFSRRSSRRASSAATEDATDAQARNKEQQRRQDWNQQNYRLDRLDDAYRVEMQRRERFDRIYSMSSIRAWEIETQWHEDWDRQWDFGCDADDETQRIEMEIRYMFDSMHSQRLARR
ncbi:uncharacterized protein PAC_06814 [Phialocephala subalpina]|uniref:Peptidase A2 domain-containing protein n=1 Tax=Phialocephala subalpina TaxID=576137 RepID=A0A1L7WVX0_9HELO|nr:uncharacterized protein PAC_06814 [Phialocephala subalpina]